MGASSTHHNHVIHRGLRHSPSRGATQQAPDPDATAPETKPKILMNAILYWAGPVNGSYPWNWMEVLWARGLATWLR